MQHTDLSRYGETALLKFTEKKMKPQNKNVDIIQHNKIQWYTSLKQANK